MSKKFRLPHEMNKPKDGRVPISARVKKSSHEELSNYAQKGKVSLSKLVENILEDYLDYVKSQMKK